MTPAVPTTSPPEGEAVVNGGRGVETGDIPLEEPVPSCKFPSYLPPADRKRKDRKEKETGVGRRRRNQWEGKH